MSFSVLDFMPIQEETDLGFQAFSCIKFYGGDENEMNLHCDYFIFEYWLLNRKMHAYYFSVT